VAVLAAASLAAPGRLYRIDRLWDAGNPVRSESLFRALLPEAEQSGDTSYRIELLTQVARAQDMQGRFEDAHATLDTCRALLSDTMAIPWVRYFLERGRVFSSSGTPDTAKTFFVQAWTHGALDAHLRDGAVQLMADAAHMMALIEPPVERLAWVSLAFNMAEDFTNPEALEWLGPLFDNAGWAYFELGDYDSALGEFEKDLAFRRRLCGPAEILVAQWAVGRTLRALGRTDEALRVQEEVRSGRETGGLPPDGSNLEELGELCLLKGDSAAARAWFARAYEELSRDESLSETEPARLERLRQLGGAGE